LKQPHLKVSKYHPTFQKPDGPLTSTGLVLDKQEASLLIPASRTVLVWLLCWAWVTSLASIFQVICQVVVWDHHRLLLQAKDDDRYGGIKEVQERLERRREAASVNGRWVTSER